MRCTSEINQNEILQTDFTLEYSDRTSENFNAMLSDYLLWFNHRCIIPTGFENQQLHKNFSQQF